MQAYQSAPCPSCGATWNQPGAQTCANCRNPLPPAQPSYAPPGYAPPGYPPPGYAPPGYAQGPAYPQPPAGYGQPTQYPTFVPGAAAAAPQGSTTLNLFGQTITIPMVLPNALVAHQKQIVYAIAGVVALLLLLFSVAPALAAGQIAGAQRMVAGTLADQAKVEAGFTSLFATNSTTDINATRAQASKNAQSINSALATVQADESALRGADLRLLVLQFAAPPSRRPIAAERQRIKTGLDALRQADEALTAGANQAKVMVPVYDAMVDFTKMYAALNRHDLAGAGAPYPDAQHKMQLAMSLDHAAGVPETLAKQLADFNDLVNNTEALVTAIQSNDSAGTKKYSGLVQAGLKLLAPLANAITPAYEAKTYGHLQKGYEASIRALKN